MKKVLPFIALVGLLLLSGCGTDMKKILTADGGKWKVEETRATYTFQLMTQRIVLVGHTLMMKK